MPILNNSLISYNKAPRSWIEVSRGAFLHNIDHLASLTKAPLAVVVKANAYGHGASIIAALAQEHARVSMLCTAGIAEALQLRLNNQIALPLLAMAYCDGSLKEAVHTNIQITAVDLKHLQHLEAQAAAENIRPFVHLKIDTGMSRLGINIVNLKSAATLIKNLKYVQVVGLLSHFCDTPNYDTEYTQWQLQHFNDAVQYIELTVGRRFVKHIHASGSLDHTPHYDLIRAGSLLYGHWKSTAQKGRYQVLQPDITLQQILTWKTRILHTQHIAAGTCIGYNRTYQASSPMHIAVLPIGYADGYPRDLSSSLARQSATVIIGNYHAPVIGMVSMNLMTIDISTVPESDLSKDVILCGPQEGIRTNDLAFRANTIENELLAGISHLIPRHITE